MKSDYSDSNYTKIDNTLIETLRRIRIPGEAAQVFWSVFRKTCSFRKQEDWISLSQFSEATGLSKPHVINALKKLLAQHIITKKDNSLTNRGNADTVRYSINRDYDSWVPFPKKIILPKKEMPVTQKGNAALSNSVPTKEIITKDNITKSNIAVNPAKIAEFTTLYNELCPFGTKALAMSPRRQAQIRRALHQHPDAGMVARYYGWQGSQIGVSKGRDSAIGRPSPVQDDNRFPDQRA